MCAEATGKTLATELSEGVGAVLGVYSSCSAEAAGASTTSFTAPELLSLRGSVGTAYMDVARPG